MGRISWCCFVCSLAAGSAGHFGQGVPSLLHARIVYWLYASNLAANALQSTDCPLHFRSSSASPPRSQSGRAAPATEGDHYRHNCSHTAHMTVRLVTPPITTNQVGSRGHHRVHVRDRRSSLQPSRLDGDSDSGDAMSKRLLT